VQQLQSVRYNYFVHAHREREIVGRILEQRIPPDVHFVEIHVRKERRQPERLAVRDEMDFVAARRERNSELRCDRARSTIRRVAGDSDLQDDSFHHR
jgi:hypothetical protein